MCDIADCYLSEYGYWLDKPNHKFRRNFIVPNFCSTKIVRELRNNVGIFKTAYVYDIRDQDKANMYGDFYLDFDSTEFELVRSDALKALSYLKIVFGIDIENGCLIFFSGNKGLHIIVPAETLGIEPNGKLNEVFKVIAEALYDFIDNKTLDLRIYDKKRMFRIPNSIHESTNLHKVNITIDELRNYNHQDIKDIAKGTRVVRNVNKSYSSIAHKTYNAFVEKAETKVNSYKNIKGSGTLRYLPPCITEILADGAQSGQRNNTVAILASYYKATGKDLVTAMKELTEWNDEKNSPALSKYELERTLQSIYVGEGQFGCSSIKNLNLCSKEYCKFKK